MQQRWRKVLVTGGAGFIGSWVVERVQEEAEGVHVLDDLSTGARENVRGSEGLTLRVGSVLDDQSLDGAFADAPDLVIHFAGIVGMRLAHSHRQRSYELAVEGARRVLERADCPVLLASSSAVYGLTEGDAVHEGLPLTREQVRAYDGGVAGYALGKLDAEQLARDAAVAGTPTLSLRFFNVVGPRQSGRYGMVLPTFVEAALAGDDLVVHGDGSQTRSFSEVRTVADLVVRLAGRSELFDGRVLNVGCPHAATVLELAQRVVAATGSRSQLVHVPYETVFPGRRDVQGRKPDTTALEELLGPVDWPDLDCIVRDTIAVAQRRSA